MRGTHLELKEIGEGWFPGVGDRTLGGQVEESLGQAIGGGQCWYTVRLDRDLEVQESGHETVSGYRLVRYQRLLVGARYVGEDLTQARPVIAHVSLFPDGVDPREHLRSIRNPDVWASCTLGA